MEQVAKAGILLGTRTADVLLRFPIKRSLTCLLGGVAALRIYAPGWQVWAYRKAA